jgi:hypothetical protein
MATKALNARSAVSRKRDFTPPQPSMTSGYFSCTLFRVGGLIGDAYMVGDLSFRLADHSAGKGPVGLGAPDRVSGPVPWAVERGAGLRGDPGAITRLRGNKPSSLSDLRFRTCSYAKFTPRAPAEGPEFCVAPTEMAKNCSISGHSSKVRQAARHRRHPQRYRVVLCAPDAALLDDALNG